MTTTFERALIQLDASLGEGSRRRIVRTEIRDDAALVFTVASNDDFECCLFDGVVIERLALEQEKTLRFAPQVAEWQRDGSARVLSWRPGRRLVARISRMGGVGVVKAWRKGRSSAAVLVHESARSALHGVWTLPRIEWTAAGADAVCFEMFNGGGLDLSDASVCERLGSGIRTLQERMDPRALPRHGRALELENLRRAAERHARVGVAVADVVLALTDELEAPARDDSGAEFAAHRDLHDGQFAISGETVAAFDFDLAARAERELDIANLCAHVEWCGIQRARSVEPRTSSRSERAILRGFGDGLDERALAFYRATTALRLALVWGARPRWLPLTGALLDAARRSIVEVARA